jgi:hypothetical protein
MRSPRYTKSPDFVTQYKPKIKAITRTEPTILAKANPTNRCNENLISLTLLSCEHKPNPK